MKASELEDGQVIDYRGTPATVSDSWKKLSVAGADVLSTSDSYGFPQPVGCTITWTESGSERACRLVFESLDAETCDGLNGDLKLWGG